MVVFIVMRNLVGIGAAVSIPVSMSCEFGLKKRIYETNESTFRNLL